MPRISNSIGYKGAQTIYYATREVAEWIGSPLNTHVTINFALTAIKPTEAVKAFGKLRNNHLGKFARRPRKGSGKPFVPTYAYVFENARDDEVFDQIADDLPHNVHVHFFIHIPPCRRIDFEYYLYESLDYISGEISAENAILVQSVEEDRGLTRYFLKGAQRSVAQRFGALEKHKPQGAIIGKRSGVSTNLGPSARKAMDEKLNIDRRIRYWHAA